MERATGGRQVDGRRGRSGARWGRGTRVGVAVATVGGLIALTGCSPGGASAPDTTAPAAAASSVADGAWPTTDPAAAGFDPVALQAIAADAEAAGSNCMAVVRDGALVASWYWNGTDVHTTQDVFSATKSVTSALVGIAEADGGLDRHEAASRLVPQWAGGPSDGVTVEQLLSNDSGRYWSAASDYLEMTRAPNRTTYAVGLSQEHAPGEVWVYNNAAIQTLDAVLVGATGEPTADLAEQRLLGPVGMSDSSMTRDAGGATATYFGLQSTCEDMARFGQLYLQQGAWGDRQVVPAEWVQASVGRPSQPINSAYGYLWWLNRPGSVVSDPLAQRSAAEAAAAPSSQLVPGAPEDMYWAIGLGGQIVQVDPGSGTVVVRLGPARRDGTRDGPGNAGAYGPADTARVVTEALQGAPSGG